jgi:hypothetical protein
MLRQILIKVRLADSPTSLNELSHKLGIERSALEGMVDYLVRRGKLQDDDKHLAAVAPVCDGSSCGGSCPGAQHCPFAAKMSRTFSLVPDDS